MEHTTRTDRCVAFRAPKRLRAHSGDASVEVAHGEPLTVGSAEDNSLVLSHPTVSRYHFEARVLEHGVLVADLESLNGTFCAAIRVQRAVVPLPATLTLGDVSVVLSAADDRALAVDSAAGVVPAPVIEGLIGVSDAIREVAARIDRVAGSSASVLVRGETGTGKEVVARAIHERSGRSQHPFEVVDCGSMPATLIASELFGHERGAFTGADRRHRGAFERADRGTVFLDEIGELPLDLQPALLGALERRRFRPLGSAREISVDVRVLAATHRDLRAAVNQGTFRADLYYRLAVTHIEVPPLRERPEDIEPLVRHFVETLSGEQDASPFGWASMEALRRHPWSGNVRELRNVVESALALGEVQLEPPTAEPRQQVGSYREARATAIASFERAFLSELMTRAEGNASEGARIAKMDRPYLLTLLRKHGLR